MSVIRISSGDFAELSSLIMSGGAHLKFYGVGMSMRPFIRDGDVLSIQQVDDRIRWFDILLFYDDRQRLMVHRVVAISAGSNGSARYLMRGDALPWNDGWIEPGDVIGKVFEVTRNGRCLRISWAARFWAAAWHFIVSPLITVRCYFSRRNQDKSQL